MIIKSYTLKIPGKIEMTFLNYGGIIQKLLIPDKENGLIDVVLGFDDLEEYKKPHPYFGAIIGRFANRIDHGKFSLDGKTYHLGINLPPNTLHGGIIGLDRVFWEIQINSDGKSCFLRHESPDGHEGYPGNLQVEIQYQVTDRCELNINYWAQTDRKTPINLTNHSYFNLSGKMENSILNHELWINADSVTEIDDELIPSGKIVKVSEALDFRRPKKIGKDLEKIKVGYDHNYVLTPGPFNQPKAHLRDPFSGRVLEIFTTEPGLQFYSGNFLDGSLKGKSSTSYQKHSGLCLETQHFPDSPNHINFPNTILSPGETFISKTTYHFFNS